MEPKANNELFNQEIAELEAKLAAKKQELLASGVESPEKHVFKEVVREHAFVSETTAQAAPTAGAGVQMQAATASPTQQTAINTLIATAFTKGIATAVKEARAMNDPYLLDLLHDRLVDEYYGKLLAARKIQAE